MRVRVEGPNKIVTEDKWGHEIRLIAEEDGRVIANGFLGMNVYDSADEMLNTIGDGDAMLKMLKERMIDWAVDHGYEVADQ